MKVVRSILFFLVLLLGFVFQIELFQNELGRFDLAYYHSMNYKVEDDKLESFLLDVKEEAKKNNIYVFSTDNYYISRNKAVLDIYGNEEEIKSNIYNVMDLKEKKYVSFASGETTVKYHDFTELKNIKNNMKCMISFIGNDKDILSVYNALSSKYNVKYFDRYETTENDMIIIVWSMLAFVLVVMNCIEALRRKKEVVIRISLGESVKDVIIKAMLIDVVTYTVVYIVAKRFVYMFFTGDYSWRLALAIYIIGAVISLLPYISFSFYDIKKAFSNADESKAVLYILYGVKTLATAVTIFT
ncbi:MAG: hypothetical protein K6G26_04960, partial [Lachnospiraceae bacterium]|nr:hypothetical protein [Lachnospiraceae bacterium]